jgi:Lon protease-like protein
MSQQPSPLEGFGGTVRLFPLPNLVLFPHAAQPLHIFEPRYRQLMADALADDRLITMALLRPGWEDDYHQSPPLHPVVCIGRIVQDQHLPDGRYNLLLHGLCRAQLGQELKTDRLYRLARVQLMQDIPVPVPATEQSLRQMLAEAVTPFFSAHPPAREHLRRLLETPISLGNLCDIFAFALPLEIASKQELLEAAQVEARARLLLRRLAERAPPTEQVPESASRPFPPEFSDN